MLVHSSAYMFYFSHSDFSEHKKRKMCQAKKIERTFSWQNQTSEIAEKYLPLRPKLNIVQNVR